MEKTKGYRQSSTTKIQGFDDDAIHRIWIKQKDKTHDAFGSQGLLSTQCQRCRITPHALQNICRRNRTQRVIKEEDRYHCKGQAAKRQGMSILTTLLCLDMSFKQSIVESLDHQAVVLTLSQVTNDKAKVRSQE